MKKTTFKSFLPLFFAFALFFAVNSQASAQISVVTQHNDNARTGANLQETILTPANVNVNKFGKLFTRSVSSRIWSQPLYVPNVAVAGKGTHNVVYVMSQIGDVYAFDADDPAQSAPLWKRSLIVAPLTIDYSVGTPTIDAATSTIYLTVKSNYNGAAQFRLYALDIRSGADKPNSPVLVSASVPGNGKGSVNGVMRMLPASQKQRPGLLLSNGYVYLSFGGSVDEFDPNAIWNGWVVAYNASTLQQVAAYCVAPDANGGGIWQANNGLAADEQGNVYFSTGNGNNAPVSFTAGSGGRDYGNCIVKLSPASAGLKVLDWFAPWNVDYIERADQDIASCGPMLIPGTNLLVTGEKMGRLFLLNRSNMGHFNAANNNQITQEIQALRGHLHGSPIYWEGSKGKHIYVWSEHDFPKAFKFNGSLFEPTPAMKGTFPAPPGMTGAMLSLSANGAQNGIVWANLPWQGDANQNVVPGVLRAFDANDLTKELWNSYQFQSRDDFGDYAKFSCPTVANGKVYVSTFSTKLAVYGLLPTAGSIPTNPANLTATAGLSKVNLNWSAASGATSYTVKRATVSGGPYTVVASSVMATNYVDKAIVEGTTYYYVISASNASGESGHSNQASATPFQPAAGTVISLDFVGGSATNGTPAALTANEVAGVVAVPNWNAAAQNQGNLAALKDNAGNNTAVSANWTCLNTASTEISESAGNMRMMKGYLSGNNTSLTQVQISGIPASFTSSGYDVYVYTDGINPTATRTGDFSIGGSTLRATDEENLNFEGAFVQAGSSEVGNYVVFTNLTGSSFTLNATPGVSTDTTPRAPLNGLQIVAHQSGLSVPGAPTNLKATAGNGRVGLTWTAAPGASSHVLQRATAPAGPFVTVRGGIAGTGYANTGLTNGTTYYFRVYGVNVQGNGPFSNTASAKPFGPPSNVISLNFVGGGSTNGTPTPMGAAENAGVVKVPNWNNLAGKSGTQGSLKQSDGSAAAGSVTWSANATGSQNITETAGDKRLMKGYIDTSNTSSTTVTVSGLGAPYSVNGYDVYVYADGDNGTITRAGTYKIGARSYVCTDGSGKAFSGSYALGSNRVGNYMIYPNVGGTGFTLTAVAGTSGDGTKSAPLNGLQIIAHDQPPSPPSVAITTPADRAIVKTFSEISGSAQAQNGATLNRVVTAFGRRTSSGAYEFWNGTAWITNIYFHMATINAAAGTWRMTTLPVGGNLTDGTYTVRAVAFDNNNQSTTVQTYFTLDRVNPTITITTPRNGETLSGFSLIGGTVIEAGSGLQRVDVVIKRLSDNFRWSYTKWVATETGNKATINGTNWGLNTQLPNGANLPDGDYEVKGVAFDNANNVGAHVIQVTINKSVAAAKITLKQPATTISTVVADGRNSTVKLTFTGPLDENSATDVTRYFIAVNGKAVAAEKALYSARDNSITLVFTDSTLLEGDEIQVAWNNLLDSQGRAVPSDAPAVFVEDE